jgi:hypothetical protein
VGSNEEQNFTEHLVNNVKFGTTIQKESAELLSKMLITKG